MKKVKEYQRAHKQAQGIADGLWRIIDSGDPVSVKCAGLLYMMCKGLWFALCIAANTAKTGDCVAELVFVASFSTRCFSNLWHLL